MTTSQPTAPTSVDVHVDPQMRGYVVEPVWADVDRPNTGGWLVRDLRTAKRLEAALLAGAVHYNIRVATDVAGATYVAASSRVMGRYMHADLRKLGF